MCFKLRLASRVLFFLVAIVICFPSSFAEASQGVVDLDGKAIDPIKDSGGKISVLIFVRTDCPISNRYAPLVQHLNDEFASKARMWLVYPDKKTTPQQIKDHLKKFHYSMAVLRDPDHALVKFAGATITPEAAVFDQQRLLVYRGRIDNLYEDASRARPAATTHELQSAIEAVIAGRPSPVAKAPAVGCYISDLE